MKTLRLPLILMLGAAAVFGLRAADTPALSKVEVIFSHPENFTDAAQDQRGSEIGRDANLAMLQDYIVRRASSLVPAGDKLTITFTDIDLAGEYEPWRTNAHDVRIVKDIYTPKMTLSFQLTDGSGKVIKQGDRHLTNLNFMMDILPLSEQNEPLAYDKALVGNWISDEFHGLGKDKK